MNHWVSIKGSRDACYEEPSNVGFIGISMTLDTDVT